ncbi:MAG: hypothetical protein ABSA79_01455 [Candidatus Bathyarchaeia archaeon]|jgi:hypothetical protein
MKNISLKAKFGWIKVDGKKYEKDIIIHSDGSITKREKKKSKDLEPEYGHTPLSERELDFLPQEKFDALYIGTGHDRALPITPEAVEILKKHNAMIASTLEIINKIENEKRKFVAIIHVTC